MTAALIVGLSLTAFVPPDIGWACRISMCVGYIGLGMLTYE